MYIITHKKRNNTDNIINMIYERKTAEELKMIDFGGPEAFDVNINEKEYFAERLAMTAALAMAKASREKYIKLYKKMLDKHLTIDIMMAESSHIVGILIRKRKNLVAVLENWEVKVKENEEV